MLIKECCRDELVVHQEAAVQELAETLKIKNPTPQSRGMGASLGTGKGHSRLACQCSERGFTEEVTLELGLLSLTLFSK